MMAFTWKPLGSLGLGTSSTSLWPDVGHVAIFSVTTGGEEDTEEDGKRTTGESGGLDDKAVPFHMV